MPSGISFQYTKGRAYFAGTDELNLEAKGVVPDVRVPVTEESVAAKMAGEDPLLAAGLQVLNEMLGEAAAEAIKLAPLTTEAVEGAALEIEGVYPEGWSYIQKSTGHAFQSPDGQYALVYDITTPEEVGAVVTPFGITDLEAQLMDTRTVNGVEWKIAGSEATGFAYRAAIAEIDGKTYVVTMGTLAAFLPQISQALLEPALEAFAPTAGN
jgi:hypothetical protein